jgi:hypothetical protein
MTEPLADRTPRFVTVLRSDEDEDHRGRVIVYDVRIGRLTYRAGAAVALEVERGWRRLFRRYRRPRLCYLSPELEPRMDRDIDTLQLVGAAVTEEAAR